MLTAKDAVASRLEGFQAGADDYLVKPIAFEELMARIRSIGRRPRKMDSGMELHYLDLSFDVKDCLERKKCPF